MRNCQRRLVAQLGAVHAMVEDRIGHGAEIELQLGQTQGKTALAVALIEHHLLGVDRPALDVHARSQHAADQRRIAIGVFKLHIMAGIRFVDREDLQHVPVVFFQQALDPLRIPILGRGADRIHAPGSRVQRRGGVQVGGRIAPPKLRHLNHLAAIRLRQAEDVVGANELLDAGDGRAPRPA